MAIRSEVKVFSHFPEITAEIEELTAVALERAAIEGKAVAEEKSRGGRVIIDWSIVAVHRTVEGLASGIRASTPLFHVFDKGSLGKHRGSLKRPRKEFWEVQRGENLYTAHRGDIEGKGIAPRDITNPARTAGRKALLDGIRRR